MTCAEAAVSAKASETARHFIILTHLDRDRASIDPRSRRFHGGVPSRSGRSISYIRRAIAQEIGDVFPVRPISSADWGPCAAGRLKGTLRTRPCVANENFRG